MEMFNKKNPPPAMTLLITKRLTEPRSAVRETSRIFSQTQGIQSIKKAVTREPKRPQKKPTKKGARDIDTSSSALNNSFDKKNDEAKKNAAPRENITTLPLKRASFSRNSSESKTPPTIKRKSARNSSSDITSPEKIYEKMRINIGEAPPTRGTAREASPEESAE